MVFVVLVFTLVFWSFGDSLSFGLVVDVPQFLVLPSSCSVWVCLFGLVLWGEDSGRLKNYATAMSFQTVREGKRARRAQEKYNNYYVCFHGQASPMCHSPEPPFGRDRRWFSGSKRSHFLILYQRSRNTADVHSVFHTIFHLRSPTTS